MPRVRRSGVRRGQAGSGKTRPDRELSVAIVIGMASLASVAISRSSAPNADGMRGVVAAS